MPIDMLIRGGAVVTAGAVIDADVAIDGERIVAVGDAADDAREEIDATGLHVFPGMIDPHVHFNEPGRTAWEGFASGTAALAAGGGTCFFDMPLNSDPPLLDAAAFDAKLAAASAQSRTDFALWGGLTPDSLDHMSAMAERGVVGFKAFMCDSGIPEFARADDATLERGMARAAELRLPVAVHAEREATIARWTTELTAEGRRDARAFIQSRPIEAEVQAVDVAMSIAKQTGCRLHVVHVSSAEAANRIRVAREQEGVDVSAETCGHYWTLTDADYLRLGPMAKCAPPLREALEVEKLWSVLSSGCFAFVASDHSPCPAEMKAEADDAFAAWGGIAGVQSTRSLLMSRAPLLDSPTIARLTATAVADRFRLKSKGEVAAGFDADLTLVDVEATYTLTRDMLFDRHRLSPYVGRTLRGVVRQTLVRGRWVYRHGELCGPGGGQLVRPDGGRAGDD